MWTAIPLYRFPVIDQLAVQRDESGKIQLQGHGDPQRFRNIRVRPLKGYDGMSTRRGLCRCNMSARLGPC